MVGHISQFRASGDYRTYTVADIPFLIIRGEDDKLRAFHNVCRHRAYTVARRSCGSTTRLSCKYHGWQYSNKGDLVKAPQFNDAPGFDMSANGLFRIHLETDRGGFIFVNFATEPNDAFPWTDISLPFLQTLKFEDAFEWETQVNVGWRLASMLILFAPRPLSVPFLCSKTNLR